MDPWIRVRQEGAPAPLAAQSSAPVERRLRRRLRLAWGAIAVERVVRAFWPLTAGVSLALAVLLSGILPALPGWLHAAALVAALAGAVGLAVLGSLRFAPPVRRDAVRRFDAGQTLHPAATLEDRPALGRGDPAAERLWSLHRERAVRAAAGIRPAGPDLRLSVQDPLALRYAAPLLLFAAGLASWGDWSGRLAEAMEPRWNPDPQQAARVTHVEAWAEPPAYTGRAPVYLPEGVDGAGTIELPAGARLHAWVHDAAEAPVLTFRPADGGSAEAPPGSAVLRETFERAEADSYRTVDREILEGRAEIELQGRVLRAWEFRVLADRAPSIEFRSPPEATRTGAVTFSYGIRDDYGADRAWAVILPVGGAAYGEGPPRAPIEFPLTLPSAAEIRSAEGGEEFVIRDLLSHPWAGAEVTVSLRVEDHIGQRGQSAALPFSLPAHAFDDPMARALAEQRRDLSLSGDLGEVDFARAVIEAAIRHPADYFDDPVPYLAARVSAARLDSMMSRAVTEEGIEQVATLLWRAARRLDEGALPDALEALRERLREVEEALERGAGTAELNRLLAELRAAVAAYLSALAESMQGREAPPPALDPRQRQVTAEALDDALRSIGDAAQLGSEEMARRELAQLRSLLENLEAGPSGATNPVLSELGRMIRDQTGIADQTMRLGRNAGPAGEGQPGQAGVGSRPGAGPGGSSLSLDQEALRRRLQEFRERIAGLAGEGSTAEGLAGRLDEAGGAMGRAAGALGEGDSASALGAQREALSALRGAAMAMIGQGEESPGGVTPAPGGPFGPGFGDGMSWLSGMRNSPGDVGLPDRRSFHRARELFEEIRRRSAERTRPEAEREYFRRLIERF